METIKFTIKASPKTKKNHSQFVWLNTGNGRKYPRLIPSKQYTEFERASAKFCPALNIDYPVNVCVIAYVERRNTVDLANMLNSIDDILVKYNTLADDNRNIVYSHDGSRILYNKDYPRVEITITPIQKGDFEEWKVSKKKGKQ